MVARLRQVKPRELVRALISLGFVRMRQKGSHVVYMHEDGRTTVIPMHRGEDIGRGLLRKILRDIELSPEQLSELL